MKFKNLVNMRVFFLMTCSVLMVCLFYNISDTQDYIVGEGDVLQIKVFKHPELNMTVRVSSDKNIIFPPLGKVSVENLTALEIPDKISNLLSGDYIINPQVTVFVKDYKSQKTVIMGEVKRPGIYELRSEISLFELLSLAGGLTKDAGDKAIITKTTNTENFEDTEKQIEVNLEEIFENKGDLLNLIISDGDSVYITKTKKDHFYVTGEVIKPNIYKFEKETTLIKAISMAGGFADAAAKNKVHILRTINGERKVLKKVLLDEPILVNDVIVVPESFF